jgi:hypothetical protein
MGTIETTTLNGRVRASTLTAYSEGDEKPPAMNKRGDLSTAFGLPERTEIVRIGRSFSAQIPAASAFSLLITIPTTRAELALQNPTGNTVSYVIERFWVKAVTSTGSAGVITPLCQISPPGTTAVADNTAVLRTNLAGKVTVSPSATLCIASTATGALTDKWIHFPSGLQSMTTNIAACVDVNCYGRYIIPPGGVFNMNAQESVSGGTAIIGVEWHEVVLDLG